MTFSLPDLTQEVPMHCYTQAADLQLVQRHLLALGSSLCDPWPLLAVATL